MNKGCCKLKRRVFISVTCRKRYTHVKRYMYSFRHQLGQLGKSLPDSCNYDFKMKRKKYCMGRYCRVQCTALTHSSNTAPNPARFPSGQVLAHTFFFLACLTISGIKTLYGPRLTQGLKTRGKKARPISSPMSEQACTGSRKDLLHGIKITTCLWETAVKSPSCPVNNRIAGLSSSCPHAKLAI